MTNNEDGLPKAYLFNICLFFAYVFPFVQLSYFPLGFAIVSASEVSLLLIPVIYFIYPKTNIHPLGKGVSNFALVLFISIICIGILRFLIFQESLVGLLKDYRYFLPLLSGLVILFGGLRIKPGNVFLTLFVALLISYSWALLLYMTGFDERYRQIDDIYIQTKVIDQGRLIATHSPLCIIGLIFLAVMRKDYLSPLLRILSYCVFSLGAAVGILVFNRTQLVFYPLVFVLMLFWKFSLRRIFFSLLLLSVTCSVGLVSYNFNDEVKAQVDRRILSINYGLDALLEAGFYGSRELLYYQYLDVVSRYWILGTPSYVAASVSVKKGASGEVQQLRVSDISYVSIALMFGLLGLLLFVSFWVFMFVRVWKIRRSYIKKGINTPFLYDVLLISIPAYAIMSFNFDLLARNQSVFFILLLVVLVNFKTRYSIDSLSHLPPRNTNKRYL